LGFFFKNILKVCGGSKPPLLSQYFFNFFFTKTAAKHAKPPQITVATVVPAVAKTAAE
jgi:hypothetical protein